jgi:hypothetical protein
MRSAWKIVMRNCRTAEIDPGATILRHRPVLHRVTGVFLPAIAAAVLLLITAGLAEAATFRQGVSAFSR